MVRSKVLGRANRESEVIRAWEKTPMVQKVWRGLELGEPPEVFETAAKQNTPSMECSICMSGPQEKERVEDEQSTREFLFKKKVQEANVQAELKHVRNVNNHQGLVGFLKLRIRARRKAKK